MPPFEIERMYTMQKVYSTRKYISIDTQNCLIGGCYIDYCMLKSEIRIPHSDIKVTVYGVEIEKKQKKNGIETLLEKATVNDIFATSEYTTSFILTLAQKKIMPSELKNVIGDLLGDSGFEPPEVTYISAANSLSTFPVHL